MKTAATRAEASSLDGSASDSTSWSMAGFENCERASRDLVVLLKPIVTKPKIAGIWGFSSESVGFGSLSCSCSTFLSLRFLLRLPLEGIMLLLWSPMGFNKATRCWRMLFSSSVDIFGLPCGQLRSCVLLGSLKILEPFCSSIRKLKSMNSLCSHAFHKHCLST
jgi:hypothetical protein